MSHLITELAIQQFNTTMSMEVQQGVSKLMPFVSIQNQAAKQQFFDRLGILNMRERTSQFEDISPAGAQNQRRACVLRAFDVAEYVDPFTALQSHGVSAFTPGIIESMQKAVQRTKDKLIIEAIYGNAYTGTQGTIPIAFDSNNVVAVNYVPTGGTPANSGLTLDKWIRAKTLLGINEVDTQLEQPVLVISPPQLEDLLQTDKVTSGDYSVVKALVRGEIDEYLGCKVVLISGKVDGSPILPLDSNGYRRCFLMTTGSVYACIGKDATHSLDILTNKRGRPLQLYTEMFMDCVRMWEEKVIEIKCAE
jgi:hypothetical protein